MKPPIEIHPSPLCPHQTSPKSNTPIRCQRVRRVVTVIECHVEEARQEEIAIEKQSKNALHGDGERAGCPWIEW